ncbi:substrate-binding domain-containing protein [Kutzneria sp. 744]|uniref:substrate-binding domain-containing protein n=1 Tax=Kutzneria sp. (strain 744) TaxID=345341 RepID=UPI0003EEBA63|nr:substrate-binding domain-containing protein [Kutzneria sp. 744]EWM10323.1 hypothetical protein KUTG_00627 [Kutzneria sp. 744]
MLTPPRHQTSHTARSPAWSCTNEAALPAVLAGARSRVDVVAICPDEVAQRTKPTVSSVHVPAEDLGRRAVDLLVARIDGAPPHGMELSAPVLTVRD